MLVNAARDSMTSYIVGFPTEKVCYETMRWPKEGKDVHEIAFSPDGKFLAYGSENWVSGIQCIYLWQITHLIRRRRLAGSRSIFRKHTKHLCFSPDGIPLASGDSAGDSCLET
jgi:WD40 repeat protein